MMLGELINRYAATEANAGQWQDVVDILSTPSIVRNNDTAWTLGMIGTQLGLETAGLIAGVMQAAGASNPLIHSAYIAISTVGLQLSSDDRQMMIGTIGTVGGLTSQQVDAIKRLGRVVTSPLEDAGLPVPSVAEVQQAWQDFINPPVPDTQSFEVLLSVNRQADGSVNAFASVTPVLLRDGKVLSRGEPVRHVNGALRDAVQPLIDELLRGD